MATKKITNEKNFRDLDCIFFISWVPKQQRKTQLIYLMKKMNKKEEEMQAIES